MPKGLPFRLVDYLEVVDWTGRQIRLDKLGAIDRNYQELLNRRELDREQ